jgi:hypothetical protein
MFLEHRMAWSVPDISPDMLVRRVTLEEHFRDSGFISLAERNSHVRQVMEARKSELAAVMQVGDELWEWKAGPHDFAEHGGLVVLRQAQVVWSSMDWKS